MKIKTFHMKINSVRENQNFSRKCELWGILIVICLVVKENIWYHVMVSAICMILPIIHPSSPLSPPTTFEIHTVHLLETLGYNRHVACTRISEF